MVPPNHIIPILLGPTAVGKTGISIPLARTIDAEIISADSRLVYAGLDIGTAKPTIDERAGIPHHLIDISRPQDEFTVADFQKIALEILDDIHCRGKRALVVGGTGLYIRSLTDRPSYQDLPPVPELRCEIEKEIEEKGAQAVYEELAKIDPDAAGKIHPNNIPRLIRAVEVIRSTGRRFSDGVRQDQERGNSESKYIWYLVGLNMDRELLYERINQRVTMMIDMGWDKEIRDLLDSGLTGDEKPMSGLGYRDMVALVRGQIDLETAVDHIKRDTRRFAKRQMTFFRKIPGIRWIKLEEGFDPEEVADRILKYLQQNLAC